jgi:glycosyltransferase involved in cell wall biosynthesis
VKILLTGFVRPSDLLNYFDESDLDLVNEASQSASPGVPLSDLAANLLDLGHEITLLTSSSHLVKTLTLTGRNLKLVVLPRTNPARMRALVFHLPDLFRAFKFLKSQEFDVIHSHWANEISLAALIKCKDTIVTFHDNPWLIFSRNRRISNFVRAVIFTLVLALSRNRVVVSESLRSEFPYKVRPKSFMCIPNSVNVLVLRKSTTGQKAEKSQVKFVMVSGEEKYKNRSVLMKSLGLISTSEPIEVVIISGSDSKCEKMISDKVKLRLTGPLSRSQMALELSQTDCVVHLSQIESFSLITAEARLLGIPLIVAKQSLAVVYTAGPSALQVDGNSDIAVAAAISKMASDPNLSINCHDSTLMFSNNLFSADTNTESYLSLYREWRE